MTMSEAHSLYKSECTDGTKVGRSNFFELRPAMITSDTPHNVCVCQNHSNFDYICSSLNVISGFPKSYKDLLAHLYCDTNDEKCMIGNCSECEDRIEDVLPLVFEYDAHISWHQWVNNKITGKIDLIKKYGTVSEAIKELQAMLMSFRKHFFINQVQSNYFKNQKMYLTDNEILVQIDFAENFSIQDQAAHFRYSQVTIFMGFIVSIYYYYIEPQN